MCLCAHVALITKCHFIFLVCIHDRVSLSNKTPDVQRSKDVAMLHAFAHCHDA